MRALVFCLQKHRSSVVHFLYRMVQNHAVAEELAQEVFLRVYRSRSTYEPTAKFTTWLFRIATHLALNALRDGKNERLQERLDDDTSDMPVRQVSDRRPSVEQSMVYQAKLDEIRRAIGGAAGKAASGSADAQVRRDGVFANRQGFELFGIGGEIAVVPGLRNPARAPGAYGVKAKAYYELPYGDSGKRAVAAGLLRPQTGPGKHGNSAAAYCDLPRLPGICGRPARGLGSPGCLGERRRSRRTSTAGCTGASRKRSPGGICWCARSVRCWFARDCRWRRPAWWWWGAVWFCASAVRGPGAKSGPPKSPRRENPPPQGGEKLDAMEMLSEFSRHVRTDGAEKL